MANTGYIEFEIADAAVSLVDPVAWVTCTERITSAGAGGAPAVAEVAATNLFVLDGSGLAHRAAPRLARHPARPGRAVIALLGAVACSGGCRPLAALAAADARRDPGDRGLRASRPPPAAARRPASPSAIVIGVGAAFALLARYLIWRVSWLGLALVVGRRLARVAGRRPRGPGPS